MQSETKYPEHDRLQSIRHESQIEGAFLEWLAEQGLTICELSHLDNWHPILLNIEKLLAKYHGVDLVKLENEKRVMIEEMRASQ